MVPISPVSSPEKCCTEVSGALTSIIHFIDPTYPGLISCSLWFEQENGPTIAVNHGTFKLAIPSFVPERNSRLSQVRTVIPQFEHSKKKLPAVLPGMQAISSYFVQCNTHPGLRRARIGFGTVSESLSITLFSVLRKSATGGMGTVATCIPSTWAGPCLWW
ncbi:hypothetical protein ARMSODRAFT_982535 [Armillaria solidipes]|uniref:Uncharacterized protein n=1 Tax=Armillaria solidipes TaxID=1076256 RepID=A0A2H3AZD4_9AGAR|nr:hypothetical protein ARMSODRAFT_982535 [Armillaria solidipes]